MDRHSTDRIFQHLSVLVVSGTLISLALPQSSAAQAKPSADCAAVTAELARTEQRLASARKILNDWPDLNRYREDDAKLPPPAKDEERVVFMGDSITDFWSNPESGGFFPGRPYVNRGISGQTTPQMLIRFRPDVIALQPKAVVILAGTNDLAGNTGPMPLSATEGNLATMAELARAHGIRVILASLLPVNDYERDRNGKLIVQTPHRPPAEILELNAWIKKYVSENGETYLDYFSAMADEQGMFKKDLSGDGLHPNAKGYAVMAPLAEQAIQAALKTNP